MDTILISGGNGLIGRHLSGKLKGKGYHVILLSRSRNPDADVPAYFWDPEKSEIDPEAIAHCDYIIHLAGAGIGDKRWGRNRKELIVNSRVKTGRLLFDAVQENRNKLKAFITSSAIGYYGSVTSDKIFYETDPPSDDFLGKTCRQWEKTADLFEESGIRAVKIRTGVVLARQGGALARMLTPVKMGFGSSLGNGKQYMPWIHMDDLCGIYIRALENTKMTGAYNAVAPEYTTNRDLMMTLAHILHKPFWFPNIPAVMLKMLFGEMSEILLEGSRVSSEKVRKAGFVFQFPDLEKALEDLLQNR